LYRFYTKHTAILYIRGIPYDNNLPLIAAISKYSLIFAPCYNVRLYILPTEST
jgi:hypothetical protein